ncbi:MAG: hypothetical protein KatS3mg103_0549 [Phycisphaerales bacterium]|nr:MAG: hypothetical protein KatS3mg103_0549 [Phycisphaerales bacterium]
MVEVVAGGVIWVFQTYAELDPVEKLVQGRYVAWSSLAEGLAVLGIWCVLLFGLGWVVFRSRELAIYSGQ